LQGDEKLKNNGDNGNGFRDQLIVSIVILVLVFVVVWFVINLVIMTFILTFVFYHLKKYALRGLAKTPLRGLPAPAVQALVYAGVIALVAFFIVENISIILRELGDIAISFSHFDLEKSLTGLDPDLAAFISQIDFNAYIQQAGQFLLSSLRSLGAATLDALLALVLSFVLVLEKDRITAMAGAFETSRIGHIFYYFALFFGRFCTIFGKVMKVQILIAACNSAIFMGYMIFAGFPYIFVLTIMTFLFSLIPVMGAILSAIPLLIIAISIGGLIKAAETLVMIIVIQAVEAYTLEPKLMSRSTLLPVSFVFVILIVSEHYLGAWGMLIGIPFFIFVMDALNIDYTAKG